MGMGMKMKQMNSGVPLMFEAQQEEGENSFRNEAAAIGCWSSAPADQNNGGSTDHGGVVVNGHNNHNNHHQDHFFSASPDPNCLPLRSLSICAWNFFSCYSSKIIALRAYHAVLHLPK